MQEQNNISKDYFKRKDRFADLLNGYIYHGQQMIRADDIKEMDPVIPVPRVYGQGVILQANVNIVDLINKVQLNCHVVLVALQNQTRVHYAMPIRVMNTDAAIYYEQWKQLYTSHRQAKDLIERAEFLSGMKKDDKLKPVITLVVYFGQQAWDGPRTLKELLDLSGLDEAMLGMIADYPMNLLEVRSFKNLEWFHSDIRQVFGFLAYAQDKAKLKNFMKENEAAFHSVDENAYDLIGAMSNTKELKELRTQVLREGGKYDMCKAIDDMIQDGRLEGRKEGRRTGRNTLNTLFQKLIQDNRQEELMQSIHDPDLQMKLLKEYSLEI